MLMLMGALLGRGCINLFMYAVFHKRETKSMLYCRNFKGKDKFVIEVFLCDLYSKELVIDGDTHK